jgi:Fe-S cluster assembly ATPase SufC
MIRLVDVSKVVSSGTERLTIVDEVTLEIPRGEFVSVIGPSGSGKSTLLSLIAGLDSPTSGEIFLDDRDITKMSEDDLAELGAGIAADLQVRGGVATHRRIGTGMDAVVGDDHVAGAEHVDAVSVLAGARLFETDGHRSRIPGSGRHTSSADSRR